MGKNGTFKSVKFTIRPTGAYGWYVITSTYRGMEIKVKTSDSELYDYVDDESDIEKHKYARRGCYNLITAEYKRIKEFNE